MTQKNEPTLYYLEPVPKPKGWTKATGTYCFHNGELYLSTRLIMQPNTAALCSMMDGEPSIIIGKNTQLVRVVWLQENYQDDRSQQNFAWMIEHTRQAEESLGKEEIK